MHNIKTKQIGWWHLRLHRNRYSTKFFWNKDCSTLVFSCSTSLAVTRFMTFVNNRTLSFWKDNNFQEFFIFLSRMSENVVKIIENLISRTREFSLKSVYFWLAVYRYKIVTCRDRRNNICVTVYHVFAFAAQCSMWNISSEISRVRDSVQRCLTNPACNALCSEMTFHESDTMCRTRDVASDVASRSAWNRSHNHRGVLFRNSNRRASIHRVDTPMATVVIRARRTIRFSPVACSRAYFISGVLLHNVVLFRARLCKRIWKHTNAICGNYIFFFFRRWNALPKNRRIFRRKNRCENQLLTYIYEYMFEYFINMQKFLFSIRSSNKIWYYKVTMRYRVIGTGKFEVDPSLAII